MRKLIVVLAAVAAVTTASSATGGSTNADWGRFGIDASRSDVSPDTTISAANISKLHRLRVAVDGTIDSSPIYVAKGVRGKDAFIFTTTYGKTEAVDASTGKLLWRFTPPAYARLAGSSQITTSTPALSTDRSAVYASASDGRVRKLRITDGHVLWTTVITHDPTHEKITSPLNVSRGLVLATTGGYIGDAPPYQGHVVTMFEANGKIKHVWNSLCANRHTLIVPRTCDASDSAIWSRNGAAVDPANGDLVVATGNAPFNGSTNWGDSVLVLSPDAGRLLRHWTPADFDHLNSSDLDLGSTSPSFIGKSGLAVQGGKDGKLRLLSLHRLPGVNAKTGGELQTVALPGNTDEFAQPTVWKDKWVFATTGGGTAAWLLQGGRLHAAWSNGTAGTTPVIAGNLLYIAGDGAVNVYVPTSGRKLASLPTGSVHWQSPVISAGRVAIPEGNANDHATTGVLDIFKL
jgi:outer membrane protein assembly factor BamB